MRDGKGSPQEQEHVPTALNGEATLKELVKPQQMHRNSSQGNDEMTVLEQPRERMVNSQPNNTFINSQDVRVNMESIVTGT